MHSLKKFYVYYIECETPNHCYIGQTQDWARRLIQHTRGYKKTWFTKQHGVKTSRILCIVQTQGEAQRIEYKYQKCLSKRGYIVGGMRWH